MYINKKIIETKNYVTKSNLPASDFVINPYIGCPHACKYCYARFMKRFTGHNENWGDFTDIKLCTKPISKKQLTGKAVFLSSVTDCYNPLEEKYRITRKILEQLTDIDCQLVISTKSSLVLRDIDLLKKCRNLMVSISINTLDENFKNDMDKADSIAKRISALKELHENGIYTVLFMSPIFPEITDFKAIVEKTKEFVNEYWFENLNLRGDFKENILLYIYEKYPELKDLYRDIFIYGNRTYWFGLSEKIDKYCKSKKLRYKNYFYHDELVKNKLSAKDEVQQCLL